MSNINFPSGFIFGTSTSSFQIEGAVKDGNRGESIWDVFSHRKGKIKTGETAETACGHYHRYSEDISLMKDMGLSAYRGSIAWTRIFPDGWGQLNQEGLDHYSRLTDLLLEAGITPYWNLFHWDLPLKLQQEMKGFQSRDIVPIFGDYAETVVKTLGDRVANWITLNEPWEFAGLGHFLGEHAPGIKSTKAFFKVIHHQLMAHGEAVKRIRAHCPDSNVGIAVSITPVHPLSTSAKDIKATKLANQFMNHITLQPILTGVYPAELFKKARLLLPKITDEDMSLINTPIDFVGVNNYQREFGMHRWWVPFFNFWITGSEGGQRKDIDGAEYTAMGWEIYPESMYEAISLVRSHNKDQKIMITETGIGLEDKLTGTEVRDDLRIKYLEKVFSQIKKAIDEGADIDGVFVWSLMDNFEWAEGYRPRFGLIHIDYKTMKRTPKASAHWYKKIIGENK